MRHIDGLSLRGAALPGCALVLGAALLVGAVACKDEVQLGGGGGSGGGGGCEDDGEPCTTLAEEEMHLLGVGVCVAGVRDCEAPEGETCAGAGSPSEEIPDNGLDDDCDGSVDEGSFCFTGDQRACFLGMVDPVGCLPHDPITPCAASDRAVGVCRPGFQACEAAAWTDCTGEVRPQPAPGGAGYAELPEQCDGLDNDCDGSIDEEPAHDVDGDGFTACGTCVPGTGACGGACEAPPDDGDVPWLCDELVDCDDAAPARNPGAPEDCRTAGDDDCRCDHGPNAGMPVRDGAGNAACDAADQSLDCSRADRAAPPGVCSDGTGGRTYYGGYDAAGDCRFCDDTYGLTCAETTGACTSKTDDCAGGCETPGAVAQARPPCTIGDPVACGSIVPAAWLPVSAGEDPHGDCAPSTCDGSGACQ